MAAIGSPNDVLQSLENFFNFFGRVPVFNSTEPFVLSLSGGLDSTVLLHALHARGTPIHAVHVNHQIQAQANQWVLHCKKQCEQLGVSFTALTVQVEQEGGAGPEAQARFARYRAIFEWMKQHGHTVLLCAHHLDDQLETILLQLLRGSGLRGVAGMRSIGPVGVDCHLHPHLRLGRPLLNCSKVSLLAYARQHQLDCVFDPSNQNTDLRRNWIRCELFPGLVKNFPQSPAALLQLAEHFQNYYLELDRQVEQHRALLFSPAGDLLLVPWARLNDALQLNMLRDWLLNQGVRCGKLKLLELARQLRIDKGGIRNIEKGWQIRVTRRMATLLTPNNK